MITRIFMLIRILSRPIVNISVFLILSLSSFSSRAGDIIEAAKAGDLAAIQASVTADPAVVNARDNDGNTPLLWAVKRGKTDVAKFLLSKGANPSLANKSGASPVQMARALEETDVLELMEGKTGTTREAKPETGQAVENQARGFPPAEQPIPAGAVDTLDYMLQEGGTNNSWVMLCAGDATGTDVRADRDPDGTDTPAFVITKWEDPRAYEVYKVTAHEIQIRYEAQAPSPNEIRIRRYEGIGAEGEAPGSVWMKRIMIPGGPGFFLPYRQDLFVLDRKTGIGKVGKDGGFPSSTPYVFITWVTNEQGDKSLFEGKPVIRSFAEWDLDGSVFEAYDYAYRNGPVGWHWYERVSTLRPMEGDLTGQIFHCENGYVFVASQGSATKAPEIYQYDPKTKTNIKLLRVIRCKSHQTPALGDQWYVIYRDTGDDFGSLQKKPGRTAHDFTIPEWTEKPGATIADIPCLYTHMPALTNRPAGDARAGAPTPPSPAKQDQGTSPEDRLKKLKDLFDQGLITKEVYDQKRQEILKSL
jgi:hypothetical protein